jgi:hypothetical protein
MASCFRQSNLRSKPADAALQHAITRCRRQYRSGPVLVRARGAREHPLKQIDMAILADVSTVMTDVSRVGDKPKKKPHRGFSG